MRLDRPTVSTLALVVVLCWLLPSRAQGQAAPRSGPMNGEVATRVFGSVGFGVGTLGWAGLLSLSVRTGAGDVIGRLASTGEGLVLFAPSDDVSDAALLYGRLHGGESGWIRIAAGPGYVESTRHGPPRDCVLFFCSHDTHRSSDVGVALQLEGGTSPGSWLGIGVAGFANLNSERSFGGVTLSLRLGRAASPRGD